jgi:hypothetical protein
MQLCEREGLISDHLGGNVYIIKPTVWFNNLTRYEAFI